MKYTEVIDFLFNSIPNYQNSGDKALRPGLKNIRVLCEYFKNPHKSFKSIHVGGTNGKGTTSTTLANFCSSLNLNIGLYTSPHIFDFRERIQVNGKKISKKFILNFIKENLSFFKDKNISFFEMTTILAFEYFKERKVDLAIVEVGLGGKFDSTNIINPLISLVTNVGLDHQKILGNTLDDIAKEKAGIIKSNSIFIKGQSQPDIDKIFKKECYKNKTHYLQASEEIELSSIKKTISSRIISISYQSITFQLKLNNPTEYYFQNMKGVLLAFFQFLKFQKKEIDINLFKNSPFIIHGRWNILSKNPYIISDGCHNLDGFRAIIDELKSLSFNKIFFIVGGVKDKNWNEIIKILPNSFEYILVQPRINRSLNVEDLSEFFRREKFFYSIKKDINIAISYCKNKAQYNDLIFIGGSLFLISDINEK